MYDSYNRVRRSCPTTLLYTLLHYVLCRQLSVILIAVTIKIHNTCSAEVFTTISTTYGLKCDSCWVKWLAAETEAYPELTANFLQLPLWLQELRFTSHTCCVVAVEETLHTSPTQFYRVSGFNVPKDGQSFYTRL